MASVFFRRTRDGYLVPIVILNYLLLCSMACYAGEDINELLRIPSEASCALAVSETGALQPQTACWQPQQAPGSLIAPAGDARKVWTVLEGWSKLIVPSGSEEIRVTRQSLPDQWPFERDYNHAWYLLEADLKEAVPGQIWLKFDAVAHSCVVFVNGKEAGRHIGGFTPFELEITSLVRPGPDILSVWVQDHTSVLTGAGNERRAVSLIGNYSSRHGGIVNGIRGGAYVEVRQPVHVARLRVRPSTREKSLSVETWLRGSHQEGTMIQAIYQWPDGVTPVLRFPEQRFGFAPDEKEARIESTDDWTDPGLWSPEHPNLYVLRTTVIAGGRSESFDTRFGFREFWIEGKNFMLNGKPIRLLGDGSHRLDLMSLVPGRSLEYNRESLMFLKRQFHFNSIRFHYSIFPSWASLAADEAGYLIAQETGMTSSQRDWYIRGGSEFQRNMLLQLSEWYWRDVNNPSVVIWDIDSEELRDRRYPESVKLLLQLEDYIKQLDPDALVEHSGGGWYKTGQDIIHIHMEEQYSRLMEEWSESGTAPVILGEFWMGGRGETRLPNAYEYSGREDWHIEEARLYREKMLEMRYWGIPGVMPHNLTRWPLFRLNQEILTPGYYLPGGDTAWMTHTGPDTFRASLNRWRFPGLRNYGGRGLAPVIGFVWPRSATVVEGEPFTREIVVCNDREDEAVLSVRCSYGSQSKNWQVTLGPTGQQKRKVTFHPEQGISEIAVRVTDASGQVLESDRLVIHPVSHSLASFVQTKRRIVVVPEIDQATAVALKELKVNYTVSAEIPRDAEQTIILVPPGSREDALGRNSIAIRRYLSSGGRLLVLAQNQSPRWLPLEMPFHSALRSVQVEFESSGGRLSEPNRDLSYSREIQVYASGHPALDGLETCDFREWNPVDGRVSDDAYRRPNALNIRTGGTYRVLLGATRRENISLVEFRMGEGTGMLCQAQVLAQSSNPAARVLLFNMLKYLDGPAWTGDQEIVGVMGALSASRLAALTGADENLFVPVSKTDPTPSLILAGDHADVDQIRKLAGEGSTVLVLSCESSGRMPGYMVEKGEGRYYSGTRNGVTDHPYFWGIYSASFLPLEFSPAMGALAKTPAGVTVLLGGHCCGHSPLRNDWEVDYGFWGLESREAAPPIAVRQPEGKGSIIVTTLEPWNLQAETHRQFLTNLLANAGIPIADREEQVSTITVKRTVPLKFDGRLDDWTSDMDDINISEYSHADPVALTHKDLDEGHVVDDLDLSAVVYLLYDRDNLYAGGILFSQSETPLLTLDLSGNLVTLDPAGNSVTVNNQQLASGELITGRQPSEEVIDTRLLNIRIIHPIRPLLVTSPAGQTFEAAIPWSSLGYQKPPDRLRGMFRLTRNGAELQRPLPSGAGSNHFILQLDRQDQPVVQNTGKVTDIDGNEYKTVIIGEQEWMAENLKTTRFNDGTGIPVVTGIAWTGLTGPGRSWYNDDREAYSGTYGVLYNWYAISASDNDGRNVCPSGWHVPADEEWTSLEKYLVANGFNYDGTKAGNKMAKSLAAPSHWASSQEQGAVGNTDYPDQRNASGFSGLPGGYRNYRSPAFGGMEGSAYWWTATGKGEKTAWFRHMYYSDGKVHRDHYLRKYGFSVRCVKDHVRTGAD